MKTDILDMVYNLVYKSKGFRSLLWFYAHLRTTKQCDPPPDEREDLLNQSSSAQGEQEE